MWGAIICVRGPKRKLGAGGRELSKEFRKGIPDLQRYQKA